MAERPTGRHFAAPDGAASAANHPRSSESARAARNSGSSYVAAESASATSPNAATSAYRAARPAKRSGLTPRAALFLVLFTLGIAAELCVYAFTIAPAYAATAEQVANSTRAEYAQPTLTEDRYVRVTLSAVGDNLMNYPVVEAADANAGEVGDGWYDFTPMYSGVQDIVATHDLNFIDIETILGGDYLGISGYPSFNSPSAIAEQVSGYGWNLATTATNHSLDMGIEGINNSSATWAQYPQVTVTGTFTSPEDRATIRTTKVDGITFAFLAYTDYLNGLVLPEGYEYAIAEADTDAMTQDVARAHEVADVVIVAMSWGSENDFVPNETQRYYAQLLANLGVDLVIGFGPHVIQPVEWVSALDDAGNPTGKQTLVVFSLGNFLSNQPYSYAEVEGCFTCAFEQHGEDGDITLTDLAWTPLINHIDGTWHQVFKLKDYTYDLAYAHDIMSAESDPIAYAYDLTQNVVGTTADEVGLQMDW